MYRKIEDFIGDWAYESEATVKIFKNITNDSLEHKAYSDGRSLGILAWHLTLSVGEMLTRAGLSFEKFDENAPVPSTIEEIIKVYEKAAQATTEQVKNKWKDDMLFDEVEMYGQKWKYRDVLYSLVKHQTHHRAQITVVMRQAGLKVTGVYGPAREEWAAMGMKPQP